MGDPTNTTTSGGLVKAVNGSSFITANGENVTMVTDDEGVVYFEYTSAPEDEARERHYIDKWHEQISAEVMQVMTMKKREADMSASVTESEGVPGQEVPNE